MSPIKLTADGVRTHVPMTPEQLSRFRSKKATTHGASKRGKKSHEYKSWQSMRQRCTNPKAAGYRRYGGRGITVCEAWMASFTAFLADMGPRPSIQHTLDRLDNDGNYEPGNCRWATTHEQAQNRCNTMAITMDGETLTLAEWCRKKGLKESTVRTRMVRGWTVREAFSAPRLTPQWHDMPPTELEQTKAQLQAAWAENARLREALDVIATRIIVCKMDCECCGYAARDARAALAKEGA